VPDGLPAFPADAALNPLTVTLLSDTETPVPLISELIYETSQLRTSLPVLAVACATAKSVL
jgi:hypothetical protein